MKNKTNFVSIILFLSVFIMLVSFGGQEAKWKGKIDPGKYLFSYGNLGHLENNITAVSENLSSDLYQFHKQSPKRQVPRQAPCRQEGPHQRSTLRHESLA
jgi:hypothetical protein